MHNELTRERPWSKNKIHKIGGWVGTFVYPVGADDEYGFVERSRSRNQKAADSVLRLTWKNITNSCSLQANRTPKIEKIVFAAAI
jgi:hypothetical protein